MKIQQTFFENLNNPKIISLVRFIELTEGRGYWKKGTAKDILIQNGIICTPFSEFKIVDDE